MQTFFVDKSQCARHTIFPGVEIFTMAGERMMLSLVEFEPHAVVEEHSHPHEQMGMVLEGQARFYVGDQEQILGPGQMYRIPGGVKHRVVAIEGRVKALDFFSPGREEYL
jgi:quercetin dioxygenase-like cupin family protein